MTKDSAQKGNRYPAEAARVKELAALLKRYVAEGRSTQGPKRQTDVDLIWDKRGK